MLLPTRICLPAAVALVCAVPGALAQMPPADSPEDADAEMAERARNRLNLRLGTASSDHTGRPTICMEVRAVSRLSIEGCGTGATVLHNEPGGEMAHFRAKWSLIRRAAHRGLFQAQLGVGFAELAIDADEPGFVVSPGEDGVEAVGPEGSVAVQWLRPMAKGWELIINTSAGLAWIPGAGELREPQETVQPFVSFEVGVGW